MADANWKKRTGIEINYSSSQSSEEDDIDGEVVERRWKALDSISAEYDHLGSTPPRTRIRNKEKYKSYHIDDALPSVLPRVPRRNTTDNFNTCDPTLLQDTQGDCKKSKRRSLKLLRGQERDLKLDIGKCKSCRLDTMPSRVSTMINIPTLVESCNRFMSLSSRPVHSGREQSCPPAPLSSLKREEFQRSHQPLLKTLPQKQATDSVDMDKEERQYESRAVFHSTFSMLIRMGNIDKNCKRTMSVEEHTWQNELKDLVWLEVCAKRAGRTPTQQDAFLCSRRDEVPSLLQEILDYKFVNTDTKCTGEAIWSTQPSVKRSDSGVGNSSCSDGDITPGISNKSQCLCINCNNCSRAIGRAMRQVVALLDSLAEAEALYPSSKAMAFQHPVILSEQFTNKTKAMCLWYNMVHHQRLLMLIIKKLLETHRWKGFSKNKTEIVKENQACCGSSSTSNESCKINRSHTVKFNVDSTNATETNSSTDNETTNEKTCDPDSDEENDMKHPSNVQIEITRIQSSELALTDEEHSETKEVCDKSKRFLNIGKSQECESDKHSNEVLPNSDASKSPYESADSSAGSVNSNESGFVSSVNETVEETPFGQLFNVYEMGNLGDLTKLRLYFPNQTSPYREYIEKMLKIRGIRRALYFLEKLHLVVLKKTRMTLEKLEDVIKTGVSELETDPNDSNSAVEVNGDEQTDNSDEDFEFERHTRCEVDVKELKKEYVDLRRYGAWSKETVEMQLPSYRSLFLLLSTLPLENIHEFLSMKLETKPDKPSVLSVKQLISELRDGLTIAVRIRSRFIRHTQTALIVEEDNSVCRQFFDTVLATFDKTLDEVYKLYLSYLSDWAGMEHLPRVTLAAEWTFNGFLARSLKPAATLAPLTFCCLTVRQLDGAADRLKKRVIELGHAADLIAESKSDKDDAESHNSIKWKRVSVCRDMQCLLTEERERTLSTAQFARTVSMHLHHNAIFRDYRQKIYKAMAHVQDLLCWTIDRIQETTSPKRLMELDEADRPSMQSRTREIVSQAYKFGFEFHKEMCRLINDTLTPESSYNPCARNSLTQNRRSKLTRAESVNENSHTSLEDNFFSLNAYTPTATNQEFTYPSGTNLKGSQRDSLDSFSKNLYRGGYKNFKNNRLRGSKFPSFDSVAGISLAELDHDDFKNGIPGCDECNRVKTNLGEDKKDTETANVKNLNCISDFKICDWEEMVSRSLVKFSKQWMNFAMERCERGRGLRPRWANHGLEFLMLTCDPQHTKHLTDEEFEELKIMMDSCISHVIGSSRTGGLSSSMSSPPGAISVPTPQRSRSSINYPQHPFAKSFLASSPPANFTEPPLLMPPPSPGETVRQGKQVSALRELDCRRDSALRRAGVIGSVRQGTMHREHFRPRPVTFKWQRGIKIGQGRFGKVYTVVNTETGQLLAMKEVSLGLGDRRAVERAANELQVLEGVVHPNLVRYYGVEIHREEMLIFMELCVEGSLDSLIAGTAGEGGLPEQLIRRYTGQLVCAVRALHVRAIAHRDIKSGNIFLTEGGNCLKLGDFGCAVKIRANTTVPGELQGYVGTQAYMAPEVFMKSSGHGRAADIWSLGCVVVEMAIGKRPWSEYDSNYQIMFVVGMGGRPEPPAWLSPEGSDFCLACLQHDPKQRAAIDTLSHHHFVKVNRHEDY